MDSKELMIEDWVEVTKTECVADGGHYITWSEYGKVIGITDSYIEVEVRDGEYNVDAHEDELKPIPLTSEILEKNGWFPLDEYRYEGDIALAKGRNYFRLKNTTICINSVHELQHALRLCGIEKEIEI